MKLQSTVINNKKYILYPYKLADELLSKGFDEVKGTSKEDIFLTFAFNVITKRIYMSKNNSTAVKVSSKGSQEDCDNVINGNYKLFIALSMEEFNYIKELLSRVM